MGDGVDENVGEVCGLCGHPVGGFGVVEQRMGDAWVAPCDVGWEIERGKGWGEDVA